jgi:hypothetical protein
MSAGFEFVETKKNHETFLLVRPVCGPRFEPCTSQIRTKSTERLIVKFGQISKQNFKTAPLLGNADFHGSISVKHVFKA